MSNADQILDHLRRSGKSLCDDCLKDVIPLKQRQQAHARCTEMQALGKVIRENGKACDRCKRTKTCTRYPGGSNPEHKYNLAVITTDLPKCTPAFSSDRQWFWEGNVQCAIALWLQSHGWTLSSVADTATKSPGKDIVASIGARVLWISVKGYPTGTPRTNPPTQARHWFSHAVFDLVQYRTANPDVELAIGLPARGVTYQRLAERSRWAFSHLPANIIWVSENGDVRTDGRF